MANKKDCAYGSCGRTVLFNPKKSWSCCLLHTDPSESFLIENAEVTKEYIEERNSKFFLTKEFHEEIQRQRGFCSTCGEPSKCVVKMWDHDEAVCPKHIQSRAFYFFKGMKIRGDMLKYNERSVVHFANCTEHDEPLINIGVSANLKSDKLLCEVCIRVSEYIFKCEGSCGRLMFERGKIENAVDHGIYCFECFDRGGLYLFKGNQVKGETLYLEHGQGKGGSLYLRARGFEHQCRFCYKFFEEKGYKCPHCDHFLY